MKDNYEVNSALKVDSMAKCDVGDTFIGDEHLQVDLLLSLPEMSNGEGRAMTHYLHKML